MFNNMFFSHEHNVRSLCCENGAEPMGMHDDKYFWVEFVYVMLISMLIVCLYGTHGATVSCMICTQSRISDCRQIY